jgi:hypothetical protein
VGSIKYLSEAGVGSATYYETTGWRGVMETEVGSPLPEKFRSMPGSVYPLYHVLADAGEFAGGRVVPTETSDPLSVVGLAMGRGDQTRLILANLTAEPQHVAVEGLGARVRVRVLDERSAEEAMVAPERFRAGGGRSLETVAGVMECILRPYAVWTLTG